MKILNAHAEAIEAEIAKSFEVLAARDTGVDFDANFGVAREIEMITRETEEVFDLWGSQIGGSAASPMELHDRAIPGNAAAYVLDFPL